MVFVFRVPSPADTDLNDIASEFYQATLLSRDSVAHRSLVQPVQVRILPPSLLVRRAIMKVRVSFFIFVSYIKQGWIPVFAHLWPAFSTSGASQKTQQLDVLGVSDIVYIS